MPNITSLQYKTESILNKFFEDIAKVKLTDTNQQIQLLKRAKELFKALHNLEAEEFAKIFEYNYFDSSVREEYEKYEIVLNFLVACIIEKYSQNDLLRYFLPGLSQRESRPEYFSHSSRVQHWFQLIGYWLRQLVNKPKYGYVIENNQFAVSVQGIKTALSKKSYVENMVDGNFKALLMSAVIKIEERAEFLQMSADTSKKFIENEMKALVKQKEELLKKEQLITFFRIS